MAQPLSWLFEITNKISSPAKAMATDIAKANDAIKKASQGVKTMDAAQLKGAISTAKTATETIRLRRELDGYRKVAADAEKGTKRFHLEMGNLVHSFAGFRYEADKGTTFNVAEGLTKVASLAVRAGEAFIGLTWEALKFTAAGDKATAAFNLNLGQTGGKDLLGYLDKIESTTARTKAQLRDLVAPLVTHQIGLGDIKTFLPAALGVEARGGSAEGALGALGGVRTNHTIDRGALEALGIGASTKEFLPTIKALSKATGAGYGAGSDEDINATLERVNQLLQRSRGAGGRKVQDKVINVLEDVLQRRETGGKLGGDAEKASHGLAASLNRFTNIPETAFEKLSGSGALNKFQVSIDQFVKTMTGPEGTRFLEKLTNLMARFADSLDYLVRIVGGAKNVDKGGNSYKTGEAGEKIITGGKVDATSDLSITAKIDKFLGRGQFSASKAGEEIGTAAADGIANGMLQSKAPELATKFMIQEGVIIPAQEQLQSHSPSRVFERLGMFTAEGYAIGLDRGQSRIDRAMAGAFTFEGNGSSGFGGSRGAGGSAALHIHEGAIVIHGGSQGPGEIAAAVLQEIRDKAPAALFLSALEQFAAERGA